MPRILCTLTNASTLINGVRFSPAEGGMLSDDDLSEDVAGNFLSIPGYRLHEAAAAEPRRPGRPPSNAPKPAPRAESSSSPAPASAPVKPAPAPAAATPTPSGGAAPVSKDGVKDHVEAR